MASGATLSGTGAIHGPTTVQSGGTLAPGINGIGTLAISNSLTLAGQTVMEASKSGGSITNDRVIGVRTLTCGGSLVVTNIGTNAFVAGDSITLFQATNYAGSFSSLTLPALGDRFGLDHQLLDRQWQHLRRRGRRAHRDDQPVGGHELCRRHRDVHRHGHRRHPALQLTSGNSTARTSAARPPPPSR